MTELLASTKDLVAEVRRLAAENPNLRYRDTHSECFYVEHCENDITPGDFWADPEELIGSCIIGQACINIGLDKLAFRHSNTKPFDEFGHTLFEESGIDTKHLRWLQKVQHCQDTWFNWADAVAQANEDCPIN